MNSVVQKIEKKFAKPRVADVRAGDTVKVHQKVREGSKERVQVFEGLVIRARKKQSHTGSITVRRVRGGFGVEKTYLLHSPLVKKVEIVKRSKVRRNYLSYMRQRTGKSARLSSVDFDKDEANKAEDKTEESQEQAQGEAGNSDTASQDGAETKPTEDKSSAEEAQDKADKQADDQDKQSKSEPASEETKDAKA